MSSLLQTVNLRRVFSETGEKLEILKGVNFSMDAGELVALTGSSGSGKSTFLNLVGMLDTPTSGEILFKGKPLSKFSSEERDMYHRKHVGFVFQFHHLLTEFTALENVCVPGRILGTPEKECRERAEMLLETVGLKERLKHLPRELSGGAFTGALRSSVASSPAHCCWLFGRQQVSVRLAFSLPTVMVRLSRRLVAVLRRVIWQSRQVELSSSRHCSLSCS